MKNTGTFCKQQPKPHLRMDVGPPYFWSNPNVITYLITEEGVFSYSFDKRSRV
jgi:hypothetical protein